MPNMLLPAASDLKVGIARNVRPGTWPINGLRHPPEGDTTGWYIWAGEKLNDDPNFFVPLHVEHLEEWCPQVLQYLGLAPGWRFLIADDYEDVWEDQGPGAHKSDYDRACSVTEEIGILMVGDAEALVLGDEPLSTTWISADDGGMFVRWVYATDEESLLNSLPEGQKLEELLQDADVKFRASGPCLVFDSAEPGYEVQGDSDMILLSKGVYSVASGTLEVPERSCCVIHRLQRHQDR